MILAGRRLQKLEETAVQVRALGRSKVLTVQTDLVVDGDVENLFAQATNTFGRLPDVVLSNAGAVEDDLVPAGEHDVEAWWNLVVSDLSAKVAISDFPANRLFDRAST